MITQKKHWIVCGVLCSLVVASVHAETKTISFDDLSPGGPDWVIVPNGYQGLQWYYFGVADGTASSRNAGMVSPKNVAFNISGEPATITSVTPFDLQSAYLTASGPVDVRITVRGYIGMTLAYENTYTLSPTRPTLVNFNYLGVDQVRFFPSGFFVMDDLTVVTSEPPPSGRPVDIGGIQVSTIGHIFSRNLGEPVFGPKPASVGDHLVDQRQDSGGGGVAQPFSLPPDNNNQFTVKIAAPPGKRFLVQPPSGESVRLVASLNWETESAPEYGPHNFGTVDVRFDGLEGTAPDFTDLSSNLSLYHRLLCFNYIQSSLFSNVLAFTSITLTATVPSRNIGPEGWTYNPSGNVLFLCYWTSQTNDPGRFVSIVPQAQPLRLPPRIEIKHVGWNAGVFLRVYGQAGRSTVVERSGDLVNWTAISTNVMPATVCPTCPYLDVTDFAVDAMGQFYRASELP